jgi:glutamine cyclotransferase
MLVGGLKQTDERPKGRGLDPRERLQQARGLMTVAAVLILGLGAFVFRNGSKGSSTPAASASTGPGGPSSSSGSGGPPSSSAAHALQRLKLRVVRVVPHDTTGFTEGLVWSGGKLYESTGLYGTSSLREIEPATGKILRKIEIPPGFFAEGLALIGDRLIQLTWRQGTAFVYSRQRFERTGELHYTGEGWGLTFNGKELVMGDGSDQLTFRDPATLKVLRTISVHLDGAPVQQVNELEWVDGKIYSNVWQTDEILRIDPATGEVEAVVDASGLLTEEERAGTDVLNGIAYDPVERHFLITGKMWPKMFVVDFVNE